MLKACLHILITFAILIVLNFNTVLSICHLANKASVEQITKSELEDFENDAESEKKIDLNEKDLFLHKSFYSLPPNSSITSFKRFMLQREQHWHSADFSRIPYCPPKYYM